MSESIALGYKVVETWESEFHKCFQLAWKEIAEKRKKLFHILPLKP